ncbi:anaerobic sulfatase maturase [Paenibacillus sp. MSJ-34]|uniref:anaerobic sulfatase maturase n=1 Tax=Paenibacillus sp. MSJ-34 TaxID=2841529 RepID=UPI001C10CD95|nr:anaerobic sulfatase maturase [Paenibacillus sp. MSJ-34]MBU5442844.1 anaerobic sulfatase maturase [Paenibacillus sp. MSJ-34]
MAAACLSSSRPETFGMMWKTVSEDCNLACDYCYYSTCQGKPGPQINRIDPRILDKLIREYMALSNGTASFAWQGGEPLLAGLDFFREAVALQAKYAPPHTRIGNSLQTNATLIDAEWARFFKAYNFLIGVSLDGPQPIHDARRTTGSGKGSYRLVMRGIEYLRDAAVDFNILTVIHEDNVGKAKQLMEFYRQEGFGFVQFIPCMDFRSQQTEAEGKYLITPEQYGRFLCEAFDIWYNDGMPELSVRFFDNMLSVYLHREAELCIHRPECASTFVLERNGDAYPCDFYINDDYKLGNVGIDSLESLFSNPVYERFRAMKPALPKRCASCPWLNMCFGGCPRNRNWNAANDSYDADYFCESYRQIYAYAHERMTTLAEAVKKRWLASYKSSGRRLPGRNDLCLCGSGKKFKQCCGLIS